ncbi:hypothetical protein SADUNF_Sadunf19G0110200 [Salix dunnii]|uniref:Uncharacterized protein n=1 Tax=Salix dunnii TaxID=1413687 RepID=A0A835MI72_9ROSI|nr:hypothetical protein SADUNF_Sadunf19G0110200 [Salix dunnii]
MDNASSSLFASANSVVKFNGLNYEEWSEQIRFSLGVMSLDQAILTDEEPAAITDESSELEKSRYETWERSNWLCLNLLRMSMAESIKPSMPKTEKAREFILKIKAQSQSDVADKSIVGSLMSELTTKRGVNIKEIRVEDSSPVVPTQVVIPVVGVQPNTEIEQQNKEHTVPLNQEFENEPIAIQEQHIVPQVPLRRSIRERRSAITDDYVMRMKGNWTIKLTQRPSGRMNSAKRRYRGEDQQSVYQRILCNSSRSKWTTDGDFTLLTGDRYTRNHTALRADRDSRKDLGMPDGV